MNDAEFRTLLLGYETPFADKLFEYSGEGSKERPFYDNGIVTMTCGVDRIELRVSAQQ